MLTDTGPSHRHNPIVCPIGLCNAGTMLCDESPMTNDSLSSRYNFAELGACNAHISRVDIMRGIGARLHFDERNRAARSAHAPRLLWLPNAGKKHWWFCHFFTQTHVQTGVYARTYMLHTHMHTCTRYIFYVYSRVCVCVLQQRLRGGVQPACTAGDGAVDMSGISERLAAVKERVKEASQTIGAGVYARDRLCVYKTARDRQR